MNISLYSIVVGGFASVGLLLSASKAIRGNPPSAKREAKLESTLLSGVILLIGMFCGARLAYSLSHWVAFSQDPWKVFDIPAGGFSWMGLALGGLIALLIFAGLKDASPMELLGLHFPLVAVTSSGLWLGAQLAGVGYGPVVPPAWWALPVLDAAGDHSSRIPYQVIGAILSLILMMIIDHNGNKNSTLPVKTLAFCIIQFSVIYILTFLRADPMIISGGQNIERWAALLHMGVLSVALVVYLLVAFRRRGAIPSEQNRPMRPTYEKKRE